jgi:hypothetical protein
MRSLFNSGLNSTVLAVPCFPLSACFMKLEALFIADTNAGLRSFLMNVASYSKAGPFPLHRKGGVRSLASWENLDAD